MFMMMMNMEQLQKYQRDIQKFTMQIMLEQSMGILPRYSREKERIVTVAYLGLTKYQSKGYSSSEGVLFTDTPTLENVYIKTYAVGNVQEEEPLICLNIKNGKVVDEQ